MTHSNRRDSGFTLIEILVVLFIISIITSVAIITISRNNNKQLEAIANELTERVSLAEEQAMLQPMVLGLAVGDHVYQFASLKPGSNGQKNAWLPVGDALLGKATFPSDVEVALEVGNVRTALSHTSDDVNQTAPQIIISTSGEITPFTIYIGKKGAKPRYAIKGDANGNVSNQLLS